MSVNDQILINCIAIATLLGIFITWTVIKFDKMETRIQGLERLNGGHILQDIKKMQADIINIKQDCINIDAKYRIQLSEHSEWAINTIEGMANTQKRVVEHLSEDLPDGRTIEDYITISKDDDDDDIPNLDVFIGGNDDRPN